MNAPQVTIEQGTLRGTIGTDLDGGTFYKFQGIPYAQPPIGNLRFKAPVPPQKWVGIFDATKEGDPCYSREPMLNFQIHGSENCLVLNVFTKSLDTNKPVLVWIHGGAFIFGSSLEQFYGPNFLLTEEVVLVTINYRLGILGFVSFKDKSLEVPGNAGFKDQVMALKWVQKNIQYFGGDPKNVTIFGESAGGASVHLQTLSPLSRGLFHKGIIQSGSALNPWVAGTGGTTELGQLLNIFDDKTLYETLMEMSVEELLNLQERLSINLVSNKKNIFACVVEDNPIGAFMSEEPLKIIQNGTFQQVPLIIGYTDSEGYIFEAVKKNDFTFDKVVPWNFGYSDEKDFEKIGLEIQKFYGGNVVPEEVPQQRINVLSDFEFVFGIHQAINFHLRYATVPIFLYRMTVETKLNFGKTVFKVTKPGVSHLDDVGYLFSTFLTPDIVPDSTEDVVLRKFVKLWTNFARFGNPTPDKSLNVVWQKVLDQNLDYLELGTDLVPRKNPDWKRLQFIQTLFEQSPTGQAFKFE